jgi:RNA polymerase sigma factor (sigma-70 family)
VEGTPQELHAFLTAPTPAARADAWARFLNRYSPLLLQTARSTARDYDLAMDAYAHVLDQLQEDSGRRLRKYVADPGSRFTTWLVVVARRACVDFLRQRYGRIRHGGEQASTDRALRRRLVDLLGVDPEVHTAVPDLRSAADTELITAELSAALAAALKELDPRQRLLLALRFEDGLTAREIAHRLDVPTPFHVYRAVETALQLLRNRLSGKGFSGPGS